ncbi:hypothetical protein C8R41DRAFT_183726 [Lentinula lateritia]|uniref:Secreted protein n=1 Tax=Lentinula lateritia TaxID=40482 RepID=A0ABQ8VN68_9AGAR|nr:hypothetical protein C8R41DRAFT_183726 [Lentinula lateritia]
MCCIMMLIVIRYLTSFMSFIISVVPCCYCSSKKQNLYTISCKIMYVVVEYPHIRILCNVGVCISINSAQRHYFLKFCPELTSP